MHVPLKQSVSPTKLPPADEIMAVRERKLAAMGVLMDKVKTYETDATAQVTEWLDKLRGWQKPLEDLT